MASAGGAVNATPRSAASYSTTRSWQTRQSRGNGTARSRASSTASRRSRAHSSRSVASRRSTRRRPRRRRGSDHEYDWNKVSGDTDELIQQVCNTIKAGGEVTSLTWKKFDLLKNRARVAPRSTPGPGAYLKSKSTSSIGKQVRSGYRSQGAVSMGPKHKKKHTFSMPVRDREARRIKTLPADIQWGKGRPSSAEEKREALRTRAEARRREAELAKTHKAINDRVSDERAREAYIAMHNTVASLPTGLGQQPTSNNRSAPSVSFGKKLVDPALLHAGDTPGGEFNWSGIGHQIDSRYATAGTVKFGKALRQNSRLMDDYISSLPGPTTYHPKHFAGKPTAPSLTIASGVQPDYNPFTDVRAAPGSYNVEASMGRQIASIHASNPAYRFGAPLGVSGADMNLQEARFEMAHERHQPLGVRDRTTVPAYATRDSKFGSTVSGAASLMKSLTLPRATAGAGGGGGRGGATLPRGVSAAARTRPRPAAAQRFAATIS